MALPIYTHFTFPIFIKLILGFYLNLKIFLVKRLVILIYFTVEIIIIQFEVSKISNSKAGHKNGRAQKWPVRFYSTFSVSFSGNHRRNTDDKIFSEP